MVTNKIENLGGITIGERNGVVSDGEFSGIKNDEIGGGYDVDVNGDGTRETTCDEVWFEPNVVTIWNREFGETRLSFELIHLRHKCNYLILI
jgi:hypothetical protein